MTNTTIDPTIDITIDSQTESSGLISIGEQLASERNNQEISVRQVSDQIKLPVRVIEAIESDRMDRIAPVFLRGYIRSYAAYLGMNAEPLLAAIVTVQAPELRSVLPVRQTGVKLERLIKFSTYLLVTTLIVPPLVYFFVVGGVEIFENEVADINAPSSNQTQSANVSQRIAEALALAEPERNGSGPAHTAASTVPLNNLRSLESQSAAIAPASDPLLQELPEAPVSILSTLQLDMNEDSWVEIESADGQRLEFNLLRAGSQRQYQAVPPFRVLLGRADAVQITLDGELQVFEGQDRGSVVEINLGDSVVVESAEIAR